MNKQANNIDSISFGQSPNENAAGDIRTLPKLSRVLTSLTFPTFIICYTLKFRLCLPSTAPAQSSWWCARVRVWRTFCVVMPSLLFPRAVELLSFRRRTARDKEQQKEVERTFGLSELAASYIPPVPIPAGPAPPPPVSCLSLVSALLDRSSSFFPSLPRSRGGLLSSSSSRPPRSADNIDFSSDDSDFDSEFDSDSSNDSCDDSDEYDEYAETEKFDSNQSSEQISRTVNEVELLEYSKPALRSTPSPPLATHIQPPDTSVSRNEADEGREVSRSSRSNSNNNQDNNNSSSDAHISSTVEPSGSPRFGLIWLSAWYSDLSGHLRLRDADRRKKRLTLRSALLIDDDECCYSQLNDSRLSITTRHRHMMLTIHITHQPNDTTPAEELSITADIFLPQLSSTFASFLAQHSRQPQPGKPAFPFGLKQSASFSLSHESSRLHLQSGSFLQPLDSVSHPLSRSSSMIGIVQSRRAASVLMPAVPPMMTFIRSHLWPLMLDYMQPATHEQTVPRQCTHSDAMDEDSLLKKQTEASEARLVEREKRWQSEIQRIEERDRRESGKENRAVDEAQRRRGRQREREKTDGRQARPRKRTLEE